MTFQNNSRGVWSHLRMVEGMASTTSSWTLPPKAVQSLPLYTRAPLAEDPVLSMLATPGWEPTVGWHIEEAATVDHLASRFGKRGDAELHSTRNAASIPGLLLAAAVFLPDSHPREISALPSVAERQSILRRIGDEIGILTHRVAQMRRISTGRCGRVHLAKVGDAAIFARGIGPIKLGVILEVRIEARIKARDNGSGHRSTKRSCRRIEKRRANRHVLRPGNGMIECGKTFDGLANANEVAMQLE